MAGKKKAYKPKVNVFENVTNSILSALEKGVVPWRKPWDESGAHRNLTSMKAYRGVNVILLYLSAMEKGYSSPYWLTFKQAAAIAKPHTTDNGRPVEDENGDQAVNENGEPLFHGGIRKGEKATLITFWKRLKVEDKTTGDDKMIGYRTHYYVFNAEQCDGIEHAIPVTDERAFNPIEAADAIIEGWEDCPPISHDGGDRAYYNVGTDSIHLPARKSFHGEDQYYSTAFHEMGHSTGAEKRLNRPGIAKFDSFGTDQYSEEELIAEMTGAFLCAFSGIDNTLEASAAYLNGWRKKIGSDPKLIVQAAGKAQKAADLILGTKWEDAADNSDD